MTNRCEAEGKLHLCTPQLRRYLASFDLSGDAVTNNGLTLENRFQQILIRAILPLIVEVGCLSAEEGVTDLFVKWCSLSQEERERVDAVHGDRYVGRHVHQGAEQAAYSGRNPWPARHDMTLILNRALAVWERIQDTQGAPGFDADAFVFTCDPDLEEELVDAARTLETILHFVAASPPGLHKWETSPWQRTLYHHLRLPTGNNSPEVTSEELLDSETVVEEGDEGAVEQPPTTTGPKSAEIKEAIADDSIEGELRPDVEDLEDNSTHSLPDDRGAIADVIEDAMSIMAQISEPLVVEERVHPSSATPPTAGTISVEEPLPGRPAAVEERDHPSSATPPTAGTTFVEEPLQGMALIKNISPREENDHPSSATPPATESTFVEESLPGMALRQSPAVEERDNSSSATPPSAGTTFVEESLPGMALRQSPAVEERDNSSSATPPSAGTTFVEESLPGMALRQSPAVEERDNSSSATPPSAGTSFVEEPLQGMALIKNMSPREERDHPSSATPPTAESTFADESLPGMALRQSPAVEERDHSSSATPPTTGTTFVEESLPVGVLRPSAAVEERDHPSSATLFNPAVKLVEEPETCSEKLPGDIHHAKEASSIKLHVAVCILERIEERSMTAIFDDELGCVRQGLVTSQSGQSGDAGDLCSALPPSTLSSVVVDREISSTALHAEGLRPLVLRSSDVEGRDQPSSAERLTIKPDSAENKREDLSDPSPNARDIDDLERPVPQAVIKSEAISLSSNFEEDQTRIGNVAPSVPSARCAEEEADGTETLGRGASPCERHGGSSTTGGMGLQDMGLQDVAVQDVGDPSAGVRREDIGAASARRTFEKSPSGLLLPGDEDDVPDTTAKL
ncbi:hypothetical protein AAG570_004813 [Ranatra chinensis]|uniref:Uncharacterized protein n=1 Tax=Ranatra chinensis TaxID=642074 RepID=A0ABD0Y474_9HEMI